MLSLLKDLFATVLGAEGSAPDSTHRRQLAAAALLTEVARADQHRDASEEGAMQEALGRVFDLPAGEIDALLDRAQAEVKASASDYAFTRLINEAFTAEEKSALLVEMWRVAFADGKLHKYEEHFIRRITALLHVPHSEFIRTKHLALDQNSSSPNSSSKSSKSGSA